MIRLWVTRESLASFILVGQHRYIEQWRRTLALRGCFFAQWRAQRNGARHGQAPRTRRQVEEALDKRLKAAILKDWLRRHGREEFERRWRPLAQVQDGLPKVLLNNTLRISSPAVVKQKLGTATPMNPGACGGLIPMCNS